MHYRRTLNTCIPLPGLVVALVIAGHYLQQRLSHITRSVFPEWADAMIYLTCGGPSSFINNHYPCFRTIYEPTLFFCTTKSPWDIPCLWNINVYHDIHDNTENHYFDVKDSLIQVWSHWCTQLAIHVIPRQQRHSHTTNAWWSKSSGRYWVNNNRPSWSNVTQMSFVE
jgi:hypothetical protein